MTSDGGQPPKKDGGAQSTLIGFPQQSKDQPAAPAEPPKKPPSLPPRHPLPPDRSRRDSVGAPPQSAPPAAVAPPSSAPPGSVPPADRSRRDSVGAPPAAPIAAPRAAPPIGAPAPIPSISSGPTGVPQMLSGPATAPSPMDPHSAPTGPTSAPIAIDAPKTSGTQPQFSAPIVAPAHPPLQPPAGPLAGTPQYAPSAGPNYYSGPTAAPEPDPAVSVPDGSLNKWSALADAVTGSKFVNFLKISARRAFRLRIESEEVLPSERDSLERASPPIVDRNLQAFLAWRRSVLFLVAVVLVPLTLIALIDVISVRMPTPIRVVKVAPLIAELVFLAICWNQLRHWAHWRRQRRWLLLGWLLFMATPFVVFIYPLSSFSADALKAFDMEAAKSAVVPFTLAMLAMLQLAPKAISLMPGLIRASLVIKLLFPGSSGPGWLIAIAAPLYALLAYVILIVPYQFTGSGWYVVGIVGIVVAQGVLARAGFTLAQPHSEEEAVLLIKRVRTIYVSVMVFSGVMIIIALSTLVTVLRLHVLDVIMSVLKFETNVLILTLIGADVVITNLERARQKTLGRDHVEDEAEAKIAAFVSLDAPHVPPPRGPAPMRDFDQE